MCRCNCEFDWLSFSGWRVVALETFARSTAAFIPSHLICYKIIVDQYEPMVLNQNDSMFRSRNKHWRIYCGLPLIGFAFKKLVFLLNQASRLFRISDLSLTVYVSSCWLTAVSSQRCFASADALILVWVLTNQRWPVGGNVCFHPNECAVVSANTLISTETHRQRRGLPTMRFGYNNCFLSRWGYKELCYSMRSGQCISFVWASVWCYEEPKSIRFRSLIIINSCEKLNIEKWNWSRWFL